MRFGLATLTTALLVFQGFAAEETLESVQKTISDKINALKGVSYTFTHNVNIEGGPNKLSLDQKGSCQYKHVGERWWMRYESKGTETSEGKTYPKEELRVISATEHLVLHMDHDRKHAAQFAVSATLCPPGGTGNFANLTKTNTPVLKPGEKVNDEECYVIEWTQRNPGNPAKPQTSKYYHSKASGFLLQSIVFEADKEVDRWTFKDHKADPELSDDLFKLEIPEGTPFSDFTTWRPDQNMPKEVPYKKK